MPRRFGLRARTPWRLLSAGIEEAPAACRFRFWLAKAHDPELRNWRDSGSGGEGVFPVFVANPRTVRSYRQPLDFLQASPVGIIGIPRLVARGDGWIAVWLSQAVDCKEELPSMSDQFVPPGMLVA